MFPDEEAQGFLELDSIQREFESSNLRGFKTDLIAMLYSHGYFVNEYDVNSVPLYVAIAVDRQATPEAERRTASLFRSDAVVRNFHAADEKSVITALGARMIAAGLIETDYVDGAIERERMSSTAKTA